MPESEIILKLLKDSFLHFLGVTSHPQKDDETCFPEVSPMIFECIQISHCSILGINVGKPIS